MAKVTVAVITNNTYPTTSTSSTTTIPGTIMSQQPPEEQPQEQQQEPQQQQQQQPQGQQEEVDKAVTPTTTTSPRENDDNEEDSHKHDDKNHDDDELDPDKQEGQEQEGGDPTKEESSTPPPAPEYDPERVYTPEQLEVLNVLVHPIWIFDYVERRMRWANEAGLEMWNAASLQELQQRDFKDISGAAAKRMEDFLIKCELGQNMTEQWTLYPKGKPCTVHMNVSGLRLSQEDDHPSLLCEGIPLVEKELVNETLRSMEMIRHLPMAVCQFDMEGNVMFQNPEAVIWKKRSSVAGNANASTSSSSSGDDQETKEDDMTENNIDGSTNSANEYPHSNHHDDDNRSTTSNTTTGSGTSQTVSANLKKAGNLLNRFVDPTVGKQLLQQIQTTEYDKCDIEAMLHTQKGPKWSAIQVRKVKDPVTGESVLLYSARDKSDKIKAQQERKAREQKSEFLAIMAHEIRTPLHQVTGFIDLLDQTSLNVEQKSFVKLLQSSAQGLMTVISDVLDYSKLEAGKMKLENIPFEVRSVVEGSMEAVRQSCEEKNICLRMEEWNKDIPFKLMGDPNRLRQILLNLLSNAVKFTKQGGISVKAMVVEEKVTIYPPKRSSCKDNAQPNNINGSNSSSHHRRSPVKRSRSKAAYCPMVKFVVHDTGMGISQEHRDAIFRKYQQADVSVARNFGGTGLGLSICQLLTQNMNGSIGVDSELGKGSSFWFTLPAIVPTEQNPVDSSEHDLTEDLGSQLQVLVVEDNKVNQKLMANMLKRMGHTCSLAENGKEAIDMIERSDFHLVLMDIQMPVMDGIEATRRLRTMGYNNLPIYGLTASVARSDFREFGFNDWLPKPIPMKVLKAKLHHFKQANCQETHPGPQQ